MSVQELREALRDIPGSAELTVSYSHSGNQIITIGDKSLEVGPMASNEEIRLALQNPFVRTENTKVRMARAPLSGIGQKLGLLVHNAEEHAKKLSERVDQIGTRMDTAVGKAHEGLAAQESSVEDVEKFVTELEKATNG